jgi:phospho-2-dehydro-3-deoxyheptonate aldolase
MAERAPTYPTTSELADRHRRPPGHKEMLLLRRRKVSEAMGGAGLLAAIGPCAMTEAEAIIQAEAARLAAISSGEIELEALYRMPFWKPRTNKKDWHGLETTDPELAYKIMAERSGDTANIAVEIGTDPRHLSRYADMTALAWKGGRNDDQSELTYALATHDTTLPIAVKNGLDGDILKALGDVERIEALRQGMGGRAILLFRGGLNATNPGAWEEQYLRAHELTGGRLLVDWAHGGEQAHDPNGQFGKSVEGQIACMEHTIDIAERTGKAPAGIFAEASSAKSPTDPVMPFELAVEGAIALAKAKQQVTIGV